MEACTCRSFALVFCLALLIAPGSIQTLANRSKPPNIVLILTDDQDEVLQSLDSMPKLKRLISDQGVRFPNMFVTTPVCCPSRSAIITGRYVHNNGAKNNSVSGGCSSPEFQKRQESRTFPNLLHKAGYVTFFAGKYLNQYGYKQAGGPAHVPPGWDWWNGLIAHASQYYYNYKLSVNGTSVSYGSKLPDYLTTVIEDKAMEFLRFTTKDKPFFMMLCPTACHGPQTFLPQYNLNFTDEKAPRNPSYEHYGGDKHWMIRSEPKKGFSQVTKDRIDAIFRNRWRTLQTVDQMIENLMAKLEKQGTLDNTIFIYSSDNGYQLGQFILPVDKRQPYEFDIRVPLALVGPGIARGIVRPEPVQSIDLAATILEFAGVTAPSADWLDGRSIVQLATTDSSVNKRNITWRNQVLIEYWGEHGKHEGGTVNRCPVKDECYIVDAANNTYSCLRRNEVSHLGVHKNEMYCEFKDNEGFKEYYDLLNDPWELRNSIEDLPTGVLDTFHHQLKALKECSGDSCRLADIKTSR